MFAIVCTPSADGDLSWFRKAEQRLIVDGVTEQLTHEPMIPTRTPKPLGPNPIAAWSIRLGDCRVYFDVDSEANLVTIRAVGCKEHNMLLIRGREVKI